jgi:Arc/MetJ-type ribon-helix-helix transcriptional regulator
MRQVLSLSISQKEAKDVKSLAKKRGFSSMSAYIKCLIELDKDLIPEKELLETIKVSKKEYKEGKSISANSIKDLL